MMGIHWCPEQIEMGFVVPLLPTRELIFTFSN